MWHIVSPSTLVDPAVCLCELALSSSLSLIEFAMVDIAVCIDAFAGAVWSAAPKVAFVDRASSRMKLAIPVALILIELAFVDLTIRSRVLTIGALTLLEGALEERAIGMSHFTCAVLLSMIIAAFKADSIFLLHHHVAVWLAIDPVAIIDHSALLDKLAPAILFP